MNIKTSTATVYHGGGRRWLTKKAAKRAEARSAIKRAVCECSKGDMALGGATPDYICIFHRLVDGTAHEVIDRVLELDLDKDREVVEEAILDIVNEAYDNDIERRSIAGVGYTTKL